MANKNPYIGDILTANEFNILNTNMNLTGNTFETFNKGKNDAIDWIIEEINQKKASIKELDIILKKLKEHTS